MVHWRWKCVNSKSLLVVEMIVHQTKFLLEDTTEIAVLLVKTKESLSKTSVLEVAIEAIDLEKIATEVDTETAMVVVVVTEVVIEVVIEVQTEVVTEKVTTAKVPIDQTDPIEEVMEIEMPVVLQIEAATEIEMLVKVLIEAAIEIVPKAKTEVAIEIEEIAVKVQTEVVIEKVVEVTTAEVSEKKIAEAMVETGLEVVIVTDQKENTNHTTARMPFLIH